MSSLNPTSYNGQSLIWSNNPRNGPSTTHLNKQNLEKLAPEAGVNTEYDESSKKLTRCDKTSMRDSYLKHASWSGVYLEHHEGFKLFHADLFPNVILCTFKKIDCSQSVYPFQIKLRDENFKRLNSSLVKVTKLALCNQLGNELFNYKLDNIQIENSKDKNGLEDSLIIKVKEQDIIFNNPEEARKFSCHVNSNELSSLKEKKNYIYVELMEMALAFKIPFYTRPYSFFNTGRGGRSIVLDEVKRHEFFNFLMQVQPERVLKKTFIQLPSPNQFNLAAPSASSQISIETAGPSVQNNQNRLEPRKAQNMQSTKSKKRLYQNCGLNIPSCEDRPFKKQNISKIDSEKQLFKGCELNRLEVNKNDLVKLAPKAEINVEYDESSKKLTPNNMIFQDKIFQNKISMRDSYLKDASWSGVYLECHKGFKLCHADFFPNVILCTKKTDCSQYVYPFQIKLRDENFKKLNSSLVKVTKLAVCNRLGNELVNYKLDKIQVEKPKDMNSLEDSLIIKVNEQIINFKKLEESKQFSGRINIRKLSNLNIKKNYIYVELMDMIFIVPVYTRPFSFFNTRRGRSIVSDQVKRHEFFNFLIQVKPEQFNLAAHSDSSQFSIETVGLSDQNNQNWLEPSKTQSTPKPETKKRLLENRGLDMPSRKDRSFKKQNISEKDQEKQLLEEVELSELKEDWNDLVMLPSSIDPLNDFFAEDFFSIYDPVFSSDKNFFFGDEF